MDRHELEKQIQAHTLSGVYLLDGTEEYLKQTALKAMIRSVCEEGLEDLNASSLSNPSLMSEKRIVTVPDAPFLIGRSEADERIRDYLVHVPTSCVLVFVCHGKADGRKALVRQIAKYGSYVTFSVMSDAELNAFIRQTFQNMGKACSVQVASQLAFVAGSDATQLMGEMGKLAAHAGDREEITVEDITAVATRSTDYAAYEIVNAVMENKEKQAFALMRDMLSAGESRIGILAMLQRQYRMLQHVSIMKLERKTQEQMASLMGMKSFVVGKYLQQARMLTPRQLRDSVQLCLDTEYAIKSGRLNQEGALEALIIKLFAMRQARGG